jgi:hypothetical protein
VHTLISLPVSTGISDLTQSLRENLWQPFTHVKLEFQWSSNRKV